MLLVTGGAGFIGSNFVLSTLARTGEPVVTLDKLTYAGSLMNLRSLEGDARHAFVQRRHLRPRAGALAFAEAQAARDRALRRGEPRRPLHRRPGGVRADECGRHLVACSKRRARTARGCRAFRFLHVSTDEVYGSLGPSDPAFTEETAYAPNSPYAASKAASDHLVRAYFHTYGLPVLTTNCSNNYGPHQFPEKLIPLMIRNAPRGQAAAGLRRRAQRARLALRGRSLRCAAPRAREGARRRDLQHRRRKRAREQRGGRAPLRAARPCAAARERLLCRSHLLRQGPPGPRPALRDEHREDRARARLAAGGELRERASRKPCSGTSPTSSAISRRRRHEGHPARRRIRHAALSGDAGGVEAAAAGVRQADGVLPAHHADARRHPRDPGHLHAAGHAALPGAPRRRRALGASNLQYAVQPKPGGIAQAFLIGREFIGGERVALVLGDNIFYGHDLEPGSSSARWRASNGATRIRLSGQRSGALRRGGIRRRRAARSASRKSRRRRVALRRDRPLLLRRRASSRSPSQLKPSARGELEITDVNSRLPRSAASSRSMPMERGMAWLDTGTHEALLEAAHFIETIERRQGLKIACPEEDRLPHGLHRRRAARGARQAAREKRLRANTCARVLVRAPVLMKVTRTELPEVLLLEPKVFEDARGLVYESYNRRTLARGRRHRRRIRPGQPLALGQEHASAGCITRSARPQGKLVGVLSGRIFDVAVDLRRSSPNFGKWAALRAERRRSPARLDSRRLRAWPSSPSPTTSRSSTR